MAPAVVMSRWYFPLKLAVFALLACNAVVFSFTGSLTEALDAAAWLSLLALFELETAHGERLREQYAGVVIHAIRLAATLAVAAAAVGYIYEREWLDAVNSWLWIAVVLLLEFEVRHPQAVEERRALFASAATALYAGLAALVLAWAWQREWFDAYDALLWLVAFVTIEINVLQIPRGKSFVGEESANPG